MKNKATEIIELLRNKIEDFTAKIDVAEIGYVTSVCDGIANIFGLDNVKSGEWIEIESSITNERVLAIAQNLEADNVGAIVVGDWTKIREKDVAKRTNRISDVNVGMSLLGRVVDALGNPIDSNAPLEYTERYKMHNQSPGILDRKSIHEPMLTGIRIVDALFPIGRGQRELIIGDRQTGKTAIAIDTILNQKKHNDGVGVKDKMYCIYVAIGQKRSSVARIVQILKEKGALDYTIVVSATASDSAAMQYIAPYTACSIGEYFMNNGMHALIVYDDLSKHAVAYRQISLLLRRPPGREAYPGDIFYLHAKLLERSAKLSDANGAGSLTALPIVETQAGDISAYIPTNIISITDGQLFLETDLFFNGIRPAINIGKSVSRVGSAAQTKAMRAVSGSIKIDMAQYNELAAFSQFSSDLNQATKDALEHGCKVVEILKQKQYSVFSNSEHIVILYVVINKMLHDIDVGKVKQFENDLLSAIRDEADILKEIDQTRDLTEYTKSRIQDFVDQFKKTWLLQNKLGNTNDNQHHSYCDSGIINDEFNGHCDCGSKMADVGL